MTGTWLTNAGQGVTRVGASAIAGLLLLTGCSRLADTVEREPDARPSVSPTVAMRLDKPEKLFGSWPESMNRTLREPAQQSMDGFKKLLEGEATSAVGTAYTEADGQHSALVSGVSGTVADPEATLDKLFAELPRLTDVKPTRPGPLGGEARCGKGETDGANVDVCVWADHHTIGSVTFIGYPKTGNPDDMFVRARSQLEHPVG